MMKMTLFQVGKVQAAKLHFLGIKDKSSNVYQRHLSSSFKKNATLVFNFYPFACEHDHLVMIMLLKERIFQAMVDHPLESETGLTLEEKVSNELEACNAIKEKCSIKCFKN